MNFAQFVSEIASAVPAATKDDNSHYGGSI